MLGGREQKRAIQQGRVDFQPRLSPHTFQMRLPDAVPIFQCCVGIAGKVIDRRQKIVGVLIVGGEAQPARKHRAASA